MPQPIHHKRHQSLGPSSQGKGEGGRGHLLADEQYINGAQVEIIKEGQGGQAIVGRVLTGIKLDGGLVSDCGIQSISRGLERAPHTMTVLPLYCMM